MERVTMIEAALPVACAFLLFLAPKSLVMAQSGDRRLGPGFEGSVGAGYMHAMGGIASVWTDGAEAELSGAYDVQPGFALESTAICGLTGMADSAKLPVVAADGNGNLGTYSPWGGLYFAVLLGPRLSWSFPSSPGRSVRLSFASGALRQGEKETGIDAADYISRWTFGWGMFAAAGLHFCDDNSGDSWGIQLRYLYSPAVVNDFASSNPNSSTDQRLMLVFDVRGDL